MFYSHPQPFLANEKTATFVTSWRSEATAPKVYNLEVWRDHNFFVGKEGVLVHNSCTKELIQEAITSAKLLGFWINSKLLIPKDWIHYKVDDGARYVNPINDKIQIRVHASGKKAHFPHNYEKPYARYEIDKDANNNPIFGDRWQ